MDLVRALDADKAGYLATVEPETEPQWFCRAEIIEHSTSGAGVRAGLLAHCQEYGARDGTLVRGTGEVVPWTVLLDKRSGSAYYRVVEKERAPDGEGYTRWLGRNFSDHSVRKVLRLTSGDWDAESRLEDEARRHHRLATDSPVADA
ncbi:hypothetical protein U9R90_30215 [Streptomyces sp. E11-3]|uniref:hypothetical protein n=1 Tax=Streptomyces sp. E11-3 TaxID=3110112 RepID=UPI0039816644